MGETTAPSGAVDPRSSSCPIPRYDVVVVGAGPSGLTTAVPLARAGVRVLLVEKHPGLSIFPKATGLRPRTMEILRSWGLEDEVRRGRSRLSWPWRSARCSRRLVR